MNMKYNNREEMKEKAIKLFLEDKTYIEIAKIIGCSRNYVSNLIKEDRRVKNYKNKKIVKLYKKLNQSRITIPISIDYWQKIGISKNPDITEKIQITVDEKKQIILIKKL